MPRNEHVRTPTASTPPISPTIDPKTGQEIPNPQPKPPAPPAPPIAPIPADHVRPPMLRRPGVIASVAVAVACGGVVAYLTWPRDRGTRRS